MVEVDVVVLVEVEVEVVVVDVEVEVVVVLVKAPPLSSYPIDLEMAPISVPKSEFSASSTSFFFRRNEVVAACIPPLKSSMSYDCSVVVSGASAISYYQ